MKTRNSLLWRGPTPDAGAFAAPHLPQVPSSFTTARPAGAGSPVAQGPPPWDSPAGCVTLLYNFSCCVRLRCSRNWSALLSTKAGFQGSGL